MLHKVTSLSENSFRYQSPVETVTKCLHRHLSTLITLTRTSHCPYPQVTCVVVYVAAPWKVVNTREEAENLQILEARQINIAHLGWSTMLTCKRRPTLTHTQRYAAFDYMFGNRHFGGRHDTPTLTLSALYAEKNAAGPPPIDDHGECTNGTTTTGKPTKPASFSLYVAMHMMAMMLVSATKVLHCPVALCGPAVGCGWKIYNVVCTNCIVGGDRLCDHF